MSNPAFMSVFFVGEKGEMRSLYGKMWRLQERKESLVANCFYDQKRWLGNLVTRLGGDWREVYCKGTWSDLTLTRDYVFFSTETAWQPPLELLGLIREVYPSLQFYFSAEGDGWDAYLTNDREGRFFTARYVLDMEPDIEYFDTIGEACAHLAARIGKPVEVGWEALCEAAEEWNDAHPEAPWPISVKRFEVENGG